VWVQVVRGYYKQRLLRIVPSYYSALLFVYFIFLPLLNGRAGPGADAPWRSAGGGGGTGFDGAPEARMAISTLWFNPQDGCPGALWANFLFVNNQLPRAGCMKYAWSQAVQVGVLSNIHDSF
jgi:peptidoglycan/LPS O-acetylase OafA/YrhL